MDYKRNGVKYSVAAVLTAALIAGSILFIHDIKHGLVFAAAVFVLTVFPFEKITVKEEYGMICCMGIFLGSSFITAFLSQLLLNESFFLIGWRRGTAEIVICLIFLLAVFVICLNFKVSVAVVSVIILLLSAVNYYVYEFKGNEFQPADIFAAQTAAKVLGRYRIIVAPTVYYAIAAGLVFLFFIFLLPKIEIKRKYAARIVFLAACIVLFLIFKGLTNHIHAQYFLMTGTSKNGYLLNFVLQMGSHKAKVPDSYSLQAVEELSETFVSENKTSEIQSCPDIIVIMDESYADIEHLGQNFPAGIEVSPFITSLSENAVHGFALSSVFGGGTPNSEYEFLTGNSLAFLPEGTYVYSQYLKTPVYSMVSELNSLGYRTVGVHPYFSTGWNRDTVYPLLGFDEIYFLESFEECEKIRGLVSDRGMFDWIIDLYEEHSLHGEQPLYLFGVTVQNHGSYEYAGDDFTSSVRLEDCSGSYPEAEQYLSLVRETDSAVRHLIEYFSEASRDVVVVFYGDHFPRLEEEFFEEVHGGKFSDLQERQLRYEVPFFIWTSYPSEERKLSLTSLNYLSSYVYEAAGIPLPCYNRFLKEVEKSIPAINSQGYYSLSGNSFKTLDEAEGREYELLNQYNILEYNSLFDTKHLGKVFSEPQQSAKAEMHFQNDFLPNGTSLYAGRNDDIK